MKNNQIGISDVRDEARRRMAIAHGGSAGSDMTQKAVNTLVRHAVEPSKATAHALRCHLAVLAAAARMKNTVPIDMRADKHWPMPDQDQATPQIVTREKGPAISVVFAGQEFDADMQRLSIAVACANSAIIGGVQAGDMRWHRGPADFVWRTKEGVDVPMDAPTVIAFGLAVLTA